METYNKSLVRKEVLAKRKKLSIVEVNKASQKIVSLIRSDENYQKASIIGIYLPIKNEIDVTSLLSDSNKLFVTPVIINKEMLFSIIEKDSEIVDGIFGTKEPKEVKVVNKIDYLVVPCVAVFNNYRLGYGGGFYDKYLSKNKVDKIVGVIYDFQEIKFEVESHDKKLDYYYLSSRK